MKPDEPKRVEINATCLHCHETLLYRKEGVCVELMSHGVALFVFFCASCRQENRQRLDPESGQKLTDLGIPTTFVSVPLEVAERVEAAKGPAISAMDVAWFTDATHEHFQQCAWRELGMGE